MNKAIPALMHLKPKASKFSEIGETKQWSISHTSPAKTKDLELE